MLNGNVPVNRRLRPVYLQLGMCDAQTPRHCRPDSPGYRFRLRQEIHMKNITHIALSIIIAGTFLSSSASALTPFDYHVVEVFRVPYFDNPIHVAIRTREEWLAFAKLPGDWPEQPPTVPGQHITPAPNRPISEIDFDRYSLLVIGIGAKTGWQLAVVDIRDLPTEVQVQYAVLRPGSNCAVAQVLGHPSISVLIPKTTKPVRFNEVAAVLDCTNYKSGPEMRGLLGEK
jgi:hypothetical protein